MFAGVGERTREGNDLYHEMIEGGVISLTDKTSKVRTCCLLIIGCDVATSDDISHHILCL